MGWDVMYILKYSLKWTLLFGYPPVYSLKKKNEDAEMWKVFLKDETNKKKIRNV